MQRFGCVVGGLEVFHHVAEPVYGRQGLVRTQVPAPDRHFLARELVVDHVELDAGVLRILAFREAADDVVQRGAGAFGDRLVAADIDDLVEMAKRRQVIGVLGFRAARVQGKVAFGGGERGRVVARLVGRVGRHHHRFAGPLRIGVLALDFLEQQDGILIVAGIEFRGGLVVELFHGALDIGEFRVAPCGLAGAKHQRAGSNRQGEGCQSGHGGGGLYLRLCAVYSVCLARMRLPFQGLKGRVCEAGCGQITQTRRLCLPGATIALRVFC